MEKCNKFNNNNDNDNNKSDVSVKTSYHAVNVRKKGKQKIKYADCSKNKSVPQRFTK